MDSIFFCSLRSLLSLKIDFGSMSLPGLIFAVGIMDVREVHIQNLVRTKHFISGHLIVTHLQASFSFSVKRTKVMLKSISNKSPPT